MKTDPKTTAARAFVRSLNILLKFARLYGYDHARVAGQLRVAWEELRTAVPAGAETGLLLGATGTQLLLDGVPLDGSPAEKQFAQLLSAAGLASVQFTQEATQAELARFVQRISNREGQTRRTCTAFEKRDRGCEGNPGERSVLRGHRFAAERSEYGGADRGRVHGRSAGPVPENVERSAEIAGADCSGGGIEIGDGRRRRWRGAWVGSGLGRRQRGW